MPVSKRRILALWFARLPCDRLLSPRSKGAPEKKPQFRAPLVISHKANNALYVYALEAPAQKLERLYAQDKWAEANRLSAEHRRRRPPRRNGRPRVNPVQVRARHVDDYLLRLLTLRTGAVVKTEELNALAERVAVEQSARRS